MSCYLKISVLRLSKIFRYAGPGRDLLGLTECELFPVLSRSRFLFTDFVDNVSCVSSASFISNCTRGI